MIELTRRCEFSASHYYWLPERSAEENARLFGKCANRNGHGHNYVLDVTVRGEVDAKTGFVIDLKQLKAILEREVLDVYDHRHINLEVPGFADGERVPTTENIAMDIWRRLEGHLDGAELYRVRLYEAEDLFVDCYGVAK